MNLILRSRNLFWVPVLIFCFAFKLFAENPDTASSKIKNNFNLILSAAEKFNINPEIISSIIFVERTLNYDWKDEALDNLIAESGFNSSIGFCQIKMKTAYWIEVQLSDLSSNFYPGKDYINILPVSKTPKEIINKLSIDSLNILYAAAYIKIIQTRWEKTGYPIDKKPEIIGTLYSAGLFYRDGKERIPNPTPRPNFFGNKVADSLNK